MILALVLASVLEVLWIWVEWIVIGIVAGGIAFLLMQSSRSGCLGNILVGMLGSIIGGAIFTYGGFSRPGGFWINLEAFIGAILLLALVAVFTAGNKRT